MKKIMTDLRCVVDTIGLLRIVCNVICLPSCGAIYRQHLELISVC